MTDLSSKKTCSGCQKPLPEGAPDGLCPECLMKAGLGTGVDVGPDSQPDSGQTRFVAPTPDELAKLFPQLEILGFIGQGGMGAVYRARQKELDRVVALKILPPGIGKDPAFAERFTREAKALAKLNHPGIVTIHDFGRTNGLFYFLMEFVDGVSLRHLLEVGRVSAREALAIVPQICDALQYAHDQGIVHRDIKPENILLDRQGRVKVADFGLAKLVGTDAGGSHLAPALSPGGGEGGSNLTDAGKVMGTPQYMAPEQQEHPTEVDHRADIYSLGVVFYQMLTGELPGKPIAPPSRKVQVDVRLDEVVLRTLEKKPELRYQQVSEVKTAVESISSSSFQGMGTPPSPARRAATRGRLRAALMVGVLVWLFVTGTVTLITWIRPESWKVVAIISCPHSRAGRPVKEHFEFTATMIELIRSDVLLGRVIDRLELDERSGKLDERWGKRNLGLNLTKAQAMVLLKRRLDVRSEGGTLIQVGVFGKRPEEPEEAMDIANTIAEELRAFRIEQHESPTEMLEMTLRFTPPDLLLGLAAGFVLGLLAGGLVLWRGKPSKDSGSGEPRTAAAPAVSATNKPAARERPLTLVVVRNGQRAIHWSGLILFAALLVAAAGGLSLVFYRLLAVKASLGLALLTGLLAGFILLGLKLKQAWTTPVERLPQLDTAGAPTRPQEPPIFSSRLAKYSLAITVLGALIGLGAIANFNFVLGVEKTAMLICGAIVLAAGCVGLALAMHGAAPLVSPQPPSLEGDATRRRTVWDRIAVVLLITAALVTGYLLMSYSARVKLETMRQATRGATESPSTLVRGALSQGEIELVGVSYHPSTNQPWWRPDGFPCPEGPFELRGSISSATGESMTREFVIRLVGLPADASGPVWKLDRGSWAGSLVYVGGQLVPGLQGISATVPKSARTVTVKVGVGMGAWESVANQVPGGSGITGVSHRGSNWVVSFPKAEGGQGGARILVTHTVKDWETRVLAVDQDDKEHPATGSESSGTDAFTTLSAKFPDLPLDQVKGFQFQVRPYQWVEFRDVALHPRQPLALPERSPNAAGGAASDLNAGKNGESAKSSDASGGRVLSLPVGTASPPADTRRFPATLLVIGGPSVRATTSPLTALRGEVRFMLSNEVAAVHWEFLKTTPTGDMYRFTRKIPAEPPTYSGYPAYLGEQQTTTKEIVYTGRELVIWQDKQLRIALRPAPAPETESRGLPAPSSTAVFWKQVRSGELRNFMLHGFTVGVRPSSYWPVAANVFVPAARLEEAKQASAQLQPLIASRLAGLEKDDITQRDRCARVENDILAETRSRLPELPVQKVFLSLDIK